jgi:tRNA G10  N-methylase Trm11
MGYSPYGSDISPKMTDYSKVNLSWLIQNRHLRPQEITIETADATKTTWRKPIGLIASETYLGKPLKSLPQPDEMQTMLYEINRTHKKFLQNVHGQLTANTRLCLAIPAWYNGKSYTHLPLLDQLGILGYNRVAFKYAEPDQLIYRRPDQIVGRELVTLIRK